HFVHCHRLASLLDMTDGRRQPASNLARIAYRLSPIAYRLPAYRALFDCYPDVGVVLPQVGQGAGEPEVDGLLEEGIKVHLERAEVVSYLARYELAVCVQQ